MTPAVDEPWLPQQTPNRRPPSCTPPSGAGTTAQRSSGCGGPYPGKDVYLYGLVQLQTAGATCAPAAPFFNWLNAAVFNAPDYHSDPTELQMRWQVMAAITTGVKGFGYFSYYMGAIGNPPWPGETKPPYPCESPCISTIVDDESLVRSCARMRRSPRYDRHGRPADAQVPRGRADQLRRESPRSH